MNEIKLDVLNEQDMYQILKWRNDIQEVLRTPYMLTVEQQLQYY